MPWFFSGPRTINDQRVAFPIQLYLGRKGQADRPQEAAPKTFEKEISPTFERDGTFHL
jgi:hypothetical protein